jgi:hypothetical protein
MDLATDLTEPARMPNATDILLEADVQRLGRALYQRLRGKKPGLFDPDFWQGLMLDWSMRCPRFSPASRSHVTPANISSPAGANFRLDWALLCARRKIRWRRRSPPS